MEPENLDVEGIAEARSEAIEQTVQEISVEKLKSIGEKVFPFLDHPWRGKYYQFLEENRGETFYHATTNDRVEIIYCRAKERGLWFLPGGGVGPCKREDFGS